MALEIKEKGIAIKKYEIVFCRASLKDLHAAGIHPRFWDAIKQRPVMAMNFLENNRFLVFHSYISRNVRNHPGYVLPKQLFRVANDEENKVWLRLIES